SPLLKTALWMARYYATPLATTLQTILPRGLTKKRRTAAYSRQTISRDRTHYLLNKDQQAAVDTLTQRTNGTVLLHGVTGSGKTAVYIAYAKHIMTQQKSVIILVPEIALTSQLIAEFEQHFSNILLTHSQQTESARHQIWLDALRSTIPRIAIGPRSALFLPLAHIGAIIIDEAHEPSFKQDQSPRYSALRVAATLGTHHGAPVIQGSATPLIGEYYLATHTNSPVITLPRRAQAAPPPHVNIINMTSKINFVQHRFLSDSLLARITVSLERKQQTLLFHNRRGSASTTLCTNCGWSAICPRCFVPFTLHIDKHILQCHICGNTAPIPTSCPDCHETDIVHKGIGTKLIESEIKKLFPHATVARFDGDTAATHTLEKRYQELYDGTVDIIIGTQVVAKGLDLPHLGAVGVIQADAGLALPDFMARERTFQLLSQVVGRVGRTNQQTNVVIQSYQPHDETIRTGAAQDYTAFYATELARRRKSHFPPFTYLLKLTCIYKTEKAAKKPAITAKFAKMRRQTAS
ncbi:primosomal protein N', partial [uncultured Campylobacter sp.]|uniref:replication restart helicase PriA n=1 Tax=uncultured Campylobacter sp. TaxID=218934 RepID=UPI00261CDEA3